ncbi:hypothetical protein TNCV_179741 [Trichonephila clavipes]|nr:hypothetical protein TNCV_179741 [Trichonephila clavipes]
MKHYEQTRVIGVREHTRLLLSSLSYMVDYNCLGCKLYSSCGKVGFNRQSSLLTVDKIRGVPEDGWCLYRPWPQASLVRRIFSGTRTRTPDTPATNLWPPKIP